MEVVLVVWVDVSPEVLMETTGGDVVVDSEEDEVENDDGELVKEDKVTGSPEGIRKARKNSVMNT